MEQLNWKPGYSHQRTVVPPRTKLTADTAGATYGRLKEKWAIQIESCAPAWWNDNPKTSLLHRDLFHRNGFHHPVRWMPELKKGWRRLTFQEFLNWYNIK